MYVCRHVAIENKIIDKHEIVLKFNETLLFGINWTLHIVFFKLNLKKKNIKFFAKQKKTKEGNKTRFLIIYFNGGFLLNRIQKKATKTRWVFAVICWSGGLWEIETETDYYLCLLYKWNENP